MPQNVIENLPQLNADILENFIGYSEVSQPTAYCDKQNGYDPTHAEYDPYEPLTSKNFKLELNGEEIPNEIQSAPSLSQDVENYYDYKSERIKADMFNRVFENEQLVFFQEQRRFMNSAEKKNLRREIIKLIDKGLLYVNEVGQIKRRGSSVTPPKKKKKRNRK